MVRIRSLRMLPASPLFAVRHAGVPRDCVKTLKLSKARRQIGDKPDILVRGDDWAEKISLELSRRVAVPAVVTELALAVDRHTNGPIRGSMSLDMRPPD